MAQSEIKHRAVQSGLKFQWVSQIFVMYAPIRNCGCFGLMRWACERRPLCATA